MNNQKPASGENCVMIKAVCPRKPVEFWKSLSSSLPGLAHRAQFRQPTHSDLLGTHPAQ